MSLFADTTFRSLRELNSIEISDLFGRCFEGYLVPMTTSPELVASRIQRGGIDLNKSFAVYERGISVAIALLAPRYDSIRLAGMGVAASARRQGLGKKTVQEFLSRAEAGGFRRAYLEVFEQNTAAVDLYRSFGFVETQRLFGFERDAFDELSPAPKEATLWQYMEAIAQCPEPLPWLHQPDAAANYSLPIHCYRLEESAFAALPAPDVEVPLTLAGFVVRPEARGRGMGRRLFQGLQALAPGAPWVLPQIFPEHTAGFLEHVGFRRSPLNQFEMVRELG